ncbi:hypothetical protein J2T21_002639 [Paeniglutamicibacter psychrophenolicus]|nr:hypothetical protein [Paeniglutamicibacter psychrophenolicus]
MFGPRRGQRARLTDCRAALIGFASGATRWCVRWNARGRWDAARAVNEPEPAGPLCAGRTTGTRVNSGKGLVAAARAAGMGPEEMQGPVAVSR